MNLEEKKEVFNIVDHNGATPLALARSRKEKLIEGPRKSKREQQDLADLDALIGVLEQA